MKCSEVFFRTQTSFQPRDYPSHTGRVGASLKRMPSSETKPLTTNLIPKLKTPINKSTEITNNPSPANCNEGVSNQIEVTKVSVKIRSTRKPYISPTKVVDLKLRQKAMSESIQPKPINKDRPLITHNGGELKHIKA